MRQGKEGKAAEEAAADGAVEFGDDDVTAEHAPLADSQTTLEYQRDIPDAPRDY
jgi:hypothetical protein